MTWWLSFAGEEGFRGVVLVDAEGIAAALRAVTNAGVNPGGEVAGFAIEDHDMTAEERLSYERMPRLQLLSVADLRAMGESAVSLGAAERSGKYDMDGVEAGLQKICDDCNLDTVAHVMDRVARLKAVLKRIQIGFGVPINAEFLAVAERYRNFSEHGFALVLRDYEQIAELAESGDRAAAMERLTAYVDLS